MLSAGHSPYLKTMSYADEFARLEEFLQADPDYARFDAECSRLKVIVDRQARIAGESERDYEAFSLCQETLEYAIHDIPDFSKKVGAGSSEAGMHDSYLDVWQVKSDPKYTVPGTFDMVAWVSPVQADVVR